MCGTVVNISAFFSVNLGFGNRIFVLKWSLFITHAVIPWHYFSSTMDIDVSKENIQPLRGGRNLMQLGTALQAQSDVDAQRQLHLQKE